MLPLRINIARGSASTSTQRGLRGVFAGICATAFFPTRMLESWLPKGSGLRLDPSHGGESHPVLFLMGRQREIHNVCCGLRFDYAFGRDYGELLIILPDLLTPGNDTQAVSLYARLFLTSFWSTLLGRFVYGFSKHYARVEETPEQFTVKSRRGAPLFEAAIATPSSAPISSATPEFARYRRWFDQPVFKYRRRRSVLASARYNFNGEAVFPVETSARLHKGLCTQTSGKKFSTRAFPEDPCGAFRFSAAWSFSACPPNVETFAAQNLDGI